MQVHETSALFVGRHTQLSLLAADARRTGSEGARAVLVCGGAGVGKSRLLDEHLRRLPGTPAAVGGCLELGAEGIPFAPFTALLRELVRSGGHTTDPTGDLGRLLPELGGAAGAADQGRARLFESVLTYLEERAGPDGLTLVIEDLHWADASTRDLLVFLLRNLGPAPIHLLISVRTDDLHRAHPLRRLLPEIERLPRVRRLDLEPLSRDEVGAQAMALRGSELDPADLDLLYERSGGNPLFVESFLAVDHDPAGAPLPDGPRDLLLAAVEPLPEPTRRVLGLVATAGTRVRHTLLTDVARRAGITEDALDSALRPAIDAQILRTTEDGYVFRHALLAEAVQSDLMPGERVRAHRRYAEALQKGVDRIPEGERSIQLAHHAHSSHDQPLALAAAWQAAEHAAAVDAYPEHLALIERVLELWDQVPDAAERVGLPRDQVLVRASVVSLVAGSLRRAVSYATDGLAELGITGVHDPGTDPPVHAERISRLRHARARALKEMGRDGALEDLADASILLPHDHPDSPAIGATLAATFMMRGHHDQAATVARRVLNSARELGDRRSEADALITLAGLTDSTESEEGLELFGEGIALARETGNVAAEIRGMSNLSGFLKNLNRLEESAQVSLEGLRRCRELGLTRTQSGAFAYGLAVTRFSQGRFAESEELLSGIRDGGVTSARALTLRMHLDLYRWRPDAVRAAVEEFRRVLPERVSSPVEHLPVHMVLQQLALYEGRRIDAGRMVRDLLAKAVANGALATMVHGLYRSTLAWHTSIAALLAEEPGEEARELVEQIRQLLAELPTTSGHADATPARMAADAWLSPDPRDALARFEAALAEVGPAGHVIVQAEYGLAAAHAALRAGDRHRAVKHVDGVHRLAVRHGMVLFERQTRVLRARHGLPDEEERVALTAGDTPASHPTAPASTALPMGLTRRELEVLTEVAKGLSNREIGQTLFISAKTVSVHVTNLMGKLGVNNRTAAAAKARELGLL
ncbi:helix-turn-helix transcriptional regulator [Nocardiopsis valliformis]|uniref:helix-turn-helix transcriptional regulator n=1 Tax=Nocardiopsis valliformis TaxID=239974 RepID=UPI00034A91A5|nr:helix-turn-helix transcriptional regulator [Nocardiopsis valliformis]